MMNYSKEQYEAVADALGLEVMVEAQSYKVQPPYLDDDCLHFNSEELHAAYFLSEDAKKAKAQVAAVKAALEVAASEEAEAEEELPELFVELGYLWTSREMANECRDQLRGHGIKCWTGAVDGGGWAVFENRNYWSKMVSTESLERGTELVRMDVLEANSPQ